MKPAGGAGHQLWARLTWLLAGILVAAAFLVDVFATAHSDVAVWFGYLVPILIVSRHDSRRGTIIFTVVCSLLILLEDAFLELPETTTAAHAINTCLQVLALVFVVSLVLHRSAALQALRESDRRFHLAMDAAGEGLWDRHLPTNHVYRSPRFYAMLGYEPGEIPESFEGWVSFIHPEDREEAVRKADAILTSGSDRYEAEYRVRAKNGQWRWICSRGNVVERDAEGRVARTMGTHADITERKRMQQEQSVLSQFAVRLAASNSVEAILELVREATDVLLGWDAEFFAVRDKKSDEYRILSYVDTVDGQRREFPGGPWPAFKDSPAVARLLSGQTWLFNRPQDTLESPLQPFGDESRQSASIITVPVSSGSKMVGVLSVQSYTVNRYQEADLLTLQRVADTVAPALERTHAEDALREALDELELRVAQRTADLTTANETLQAEIAMRRRVEDALKEHERSLMMLMANLPGAAYRCRMGADWKPEYFSDGVVALTGHAVNEFIEGTVSFASLIHSDDHQMVWDRIDEAIKKHSQYTVEYRIRNAAGQERWMWERGQAVYLETGEALILEGFIADITERKRAAEALLESEERFRFAMEATRDALWDWNITTDEAHFSPGYYRMLGYEPGEFEMAGRMWLELLHPEDRDRAVHANLECIENSALGFEVEFRMRTKAGDYRWVLGRGRAMARDASGRATRLVGTHIDITERKRAEEMLRISELKYRSLVQNIPGMVYRAFPDWTAEIISKTDALSGYSNAEINALKHGWLDLIHPDDRERVFKEGTPLLDGPGGLVHNYRIICKHGQIKWVEDRKISFFSEAGVFLGIDGVVLDITERKQVEQALRASEAKYRSLVENIPGIVYQAHEDWATEFISGAQQLCGYTNDEIRAMGHDWLDVVHPEDVEPFRKACEPLFREPASFVLTYRIVTKDGQVRWLEDRGASFFSEDGRFERMDGIVLDITERKQVEQALRASRRDLARLSHDRESLLEQERIRISRHLHDELGQSLTFLMMELSRFQKRADKSDPSFADELRQACDQARKMIENVRAVARSLRPISIEHDGLVPSLRSCTNQFQRASGISCQLLCEVDDIMVSEPVATTVYRIVQEALTNVARHANATQCRIRLAAKAGAIELTIRDNGRGAEASALHGHESLGIVGMKERAVAVGGRVQIRNNPGSGVLVKARFPLGFSVSRDEATEN